MAIKTVFIDDFDGQPISGNTSTTTFSLNDATYEIDLAPDNLAKLKEALAPFVKAGRRVSASKTAATGSERSSRPTAKRRGAGRHSNGAKDVTAIREWARANGHAVGDRGRIPAGIIAQYEASK